MDLNHRLPLCRRGTLAGLSYASEPFLLRRSEANFWQENRDLHPERTVLETGSLLEPILLWRSQMGVEVEFESTPVP